MNLTTSTTRILRSSLLFAVLLCLSLARTTAAQGHPDDNLYKPIPSGPGIQICEPIVTGGDPSLADFGSGCALWLQWSMGFQPQLGQTPRFELAARACVELHLPRLRLTLAQADRLYNILGVTHAAVGGISGTESAFTLTYQLYAEPSHKPVGAPIKLSGSESDVIKQLPTAARTLLTDLGVNDQHIPESVGAVPADIAALGHYDWYDITTQSLPDQPQIDGLAKNLPVAALISFLHRGRTSSFRNESELGQLLEQAPGNFLTYGVVITSITRAPDALAHKIDLAVAKIAAPNNAILAYWAITTSRSINDRVKAIERLVRLAPNSTTAWNMLARTYGDQANAMRSGRVAGAITDQESTTFDKIYGREIYAAEHAVAIDSNYENAWLEIASAALFAGSPQRADEALWKAISLDKSDIAAYNWGLEMYQPKWGGDPQKLAKVADLAVKATFPASVDLYGLGQELRSAGFQAEAKSVFEHAIVNDREWVRQRPDDAAAHARLGYHLAEQHHEDEALPELQTAIRMNPNSDIGHFQLALMYGRQGKYEEAVEQFRETVRINNGNDAKYGLGCALSNLGKNEEAAAILRDLIPLEPGAFAPHYQLGVVLGRMNQSDAAVSEFNRAIQLGPEQSLIHRDFGRFYYEHKKYEKGIEEETVAMRISPNDFWINVYLARSYTGAQDNDNAIKFYKGAIAILDNNPVIHFELGQLMIKAGKKDEGRAELKRVLELMPDEDMLKSTKELLDKNP